MLYVYVYTEVRALSASNQTGSLLILECINYEAYRRTGVFSGFLCCSYSLNANKNTQSIHLESDHDHKICIAKSMFYFAQKKYPCSTLENP